MMKLKKSLNQEEQIAAENNFSKLPEFCYAPDKMNPGRLIYIKRGDSQFSPTDFPAQYLVILNMQLKVTPAQMEAMIMGSMFGWHLSGADPDSFKGKVPDLFQ